MSEISRETLKLKRIHDKIDIEQSKLNIMKTQNLIAHNSPQNNLSIEEFISRETYIINLYS